MADHAQLLYGWLITVAICAVIGAAIGMTKGVASAGFFYGLLLGPLGILLVAVAEDERIQCPVCRELIRRSATICPKCQSDMAHLQPHAPSQANRPMKPGSVQVTPKVVPKAPRVVAKATRAVAKVTQALEKVSQALKQAPGVIIRKPLKVIRDVQRTVETAPLARVPKALRAPGAEPPREIPKAPRFFIYRPGDEVHGPFDLAQIKALEECGVITGETQYCREGENEWKPSLTV